jgi:signal transduction histidine kinase
MENPDNRAMNIEFKRIESAIVKKTGQGSPDYIYDFLNKVELGILILDCLNREIIFSNHHFNTLDETHGQEILDHIFNCLESKRNCLYQEINIPAGISIGYSTYQVTEFDYLILLTDISNKKIFLETKGENYYYNKLSTFMAEISHEIGNPLTSVIMTLQVLLKNISTWNTNEKTEYIRQSIDELKRLSEFIKKIRDLSREDKIKKKKVSLKPAVKKLFLQNKVLLDSGNISFINDVDENVEVVIDEDAFYQVLFNLLQNSIDCLSGTGKKGVISVNVEEVSDFFVKFVYRNNGPPILPVMREKIFMPFFSTKDNGRGVGLGLNISRKLMSRMGGTIEAEVPEEDEGWGAKFVLHIPIEEENQNKQSKQWKKYNKNNRRKKNGKIKDSIS